MNSTTKNLLNDVLLAADKVVNDTAVSIENFMDLEASLARYYSHLGETLKVSKKGSSTSTSFLEGRVVYMPKTDLPMGTFRA